MMNSPKWLIWPTPLALGLVLGCLGPPEEDSVALADLLGDPESAPFVEELPDYPERAVHFTRSAVRLRAFAEGAPVWFWEVDGDNSNLIAPAYAIVDANGERLQQPIVDVLPGDPGYTPWWRIIEYRVTELWNQEVFTSRAAIDAGAREGILEGPFATVNILNAPVCDPNLTIDDGDTVTVRTSQIWFRGARAHWIAFNQSLTLPVTERTMPVKPLYRLQRIDESLPLDEFRTGVDRNGDGILDASNNIFAVNFGSEGYTPLWNVVEIRTTADYRSFDSQPVPTTVDLSAESQFLVDGELILPALSMTEFPEQLVNCPIQSMKGQFP